MCMEYFEPAGAVKRPKTPSLMAFLEPENPVPIRLFILHLQVSTFIMKNMKFTRQKVIYKEGGTVKNE